MKKLSLVALIALSFAAQAQTIAVSKNEGGGLIRLLSLQGSCKKGLRTMFSSLPSGMTLTGCWMPLDDQILVRFQDGDIRMYSMDGFVMVNKPTKQSGNSL